MKKILQIIWAAPLVAFFVFAFGAALYEHWTFTEREYGFWAALITTIAPLWIASGLFFLIRK
jgi:hypothetical protein